MVALVLALLLADKPPAHPPLTKGGEGGGWPALLQKPFENLPDRDLGLRPLLVDAQGKKITTRAGWKEARKKLHDAWRERLGKPPAPPKKLKVRVQKTEKLD